MKTNQHTRWMIKGAIKTIALPFAVWLIFQILDTAIAGVGVITTLADLKGLLRTVITSFGFAIALDLNLSNGRMDLSAGSQMYLGCILGGNLALQLGLGGVGVLVMSMVVGCLAGIVVGVVFINLRILPMVLGIGMALIYETLSFGAYNQQGLMLYGKPGVGILSNVYFIVIVAVLLLLILSYLYKFSKFGYEWHAIAGSQNLASDSGINIFSNCIKSYAIAGALVACAGVFETAYSGTLAPVMGMTSNGLVFKNLFPMFLGIWIGSFMKNNILGILIGSLSVKILTIGLSKLAVGVAMSNIIIYSLFLLLQVYRMNAYRIQYYKDKRSRIALAKRTQAAFAVA